MGMTFDTMIDYLERVNEEVDTPVAEARATYRVTTNRIAKADFRRELIDFVGHIHREMWNGAEIPDHRAWNIVEQALGRGPYLNEHIYNAVTGQDGGFQRLLDAVAAKIKDIEGHEYIENVLSQVSDRDYDSLFELMSEFLKRYSHHICGVPRSPAELVPVWRQVMTGYAQTVRSARAKYARI